MTYFKFPTWKLSSATSPRVHAQFHLKLFICLTDRTENVRFLSVCGDVPFKPHKSTTLNTFGGLTRLSGNTVKYNYGVIGCQREKGYILTGAELSAHLSAVFASSDSDALMSFGRRRKKNAWRQSAVLLGNTFSVVGSLTCVKMVNDVGAKLLSG